MAPVVIPKILLRPLAKLSAYIKTPVGVPYSYFLSGRKDKKLITINQTLYTLFLIFFFTPSSSFPLSPQLFRLGCAKILKYFTFYIPHPFFILLTVIPQLQFPRFEPKSFVFNT